MRTLTWRLLLVVCVAGCSEKSGNTQSSESAKKSAAEQPKKVATETTTKSAPKAALDCPSKFKFPERAAGAPVDDVIGIRQGAKLSDATLFLKCQPDAHFVFTEEAHGVLKPHGQKIRQVVTGTDGVPRAKPYNWAKGIQGGEKGTPEFDLVTEQVMFWTLGFRDNEVVWGVARTQIFKPDEQPALEKVTEQLSAKYGQANFVAEGGTRLGWIYDSFGRPTSKGGEQLTRCSNGGLYQGGGSATGDCGLTIKAFIVKALNNPLLVEKVTVGVIDQGKYVAAAAEFEQALIAAEAQQQTNEAAKAAKSAPATKF